MDEINEKIQNAYRESILGERKFDLGSGTMGNGVVIWNRAKEVHGDYEKVAHIDQNRKIKYYIKNPPKQVKDYAEKIAKGKNFASTSSQPHMKVFKESVDNELNEASEVEFQEFDKSKQAFITKLVGKGKENKQTYFSGIHGTIISLHDGMRPAMRLTMKDIKKLASNKDIRWIDVESIGMGYNKETEK